MGFVMSNGRDHYLQGKAQAKRAVAAQLAEENKTYDDLNRDMGALDGRRKAVMERGPTALIEGDCHDASGQLVNMMTVAYVGLRPDSTVRRPTVGAEWYRSPEEEGDGVGKLVGGEPSARRLTDNLNIRHILQPSGLTKCTFYAPRPEARGERAIIRDGDNVTSALVSTDIRVVKQADEMRIPGLAFFPTPSDFKRGGASYMALHKERRGWWHWWVELPAVLESPAPGSPVAPPTPEMLQQAEHLAAYAAAQRVPFREVPFGVRHKIYHGVSVLPSDW